MKCIRLFYLFFILCSVYGFSQETFTKHTVEKGETISEIAKKYHVEPKAIYDLNPDASKGIKYKSVLIIPKTSSLEEKYAENKIEKSGLTHKVLNKETLFSIAKQYKVKVQDLYALNPNLEKEGLKNGQIINITKSNVSDRVKQNSTETEGIEYEVFPKVTKYSIAKTYGISVERLEKANPILQTEELKVGQKIIIPVKPYNPDLAVADKYKGETKVVETSKVVSSVEVKKPEIQKPKEKVVVQKPIAVEENAKKEPEKTTSVAEGIEYEVLPKATKYSIAKAYGISVERLEKANPILITEELKIGQKIIIPVKPYNPNDSVLETTKVDVKVTETSTPVSNDKTIIKKQEKVLSQNGQSNVDGKTSVVYEVLPKESLYSIAKQYGITLSDLKKANPELGEKSLKVGQKIKVPVNVDDNSSWLPDHKEVKSQKVIAVVQQNIEEKNPEIEMTHEVLPKETKYGIAKQYGITVAELEKQNPNISKKMLVGSLLKIRGSKFIEKEFTGDKSIANEAPFVKEKNENKETNSVRDEGFVDQLIMKASENIGTPYRSGGTTTSGFDCSGLMCYTFSSYDIKLPRSSIEMAAYGSKVDAQNAQKGDLIFFKTRGSGRINHVGMVVEVLDGEIKFIHSASHGGVIISSTKESYYERSFAQINRVL